MDRRLPLLTAVFALALSACAHAAYAPKFTAKVDPATPGATAAITTTVTQAAGETPNKTVTVMFPIGFAANPAAKLVICTDAEEATKQCPADTQIGTASATASVLGVPIDLPGTVHYGAPDAQGIKLIVFLRSQLAGDQTVEGHVQFRSDGGINVVFGPLPNTLTTSFTLALDGGEKALSVTPDCGSYSLDASFVSQNGETATSSAPFTIGGCPPKKLSVLNVDVSRTGNATFNLTAPATGTVTIKRGTTKVASKAFTGKAGLNSVKTRHALKPGAYKVKVSATSADGQVVAKTKTVRIPKKG